MEPLDKLKNIRKSAGITLRDLARLTDLSANYLSQIERGRANPSIGALKRITDALGITFMSLVENEAENGAAAEAEGQTEQNSTPKKAPRINRAEVVKAAQRKTLVYPGGSRQASLLTPDLQGALEVLLSVEEPAPLGSGDWYTHEGEEFGLVLEGSYEVTVEDEVFRLEEGDSIRLPSNLPHKMRNPGQKPARLLWVITPPSF